MRFILYNSLKIFKDDTVKMNSNSSYQRESVYSCLFIELLLKYKIAKQVKLTLVGNFANLVPNTIWIGDDKW